MSLSRFLRPKKCSSFVYFIRKYSFYDQNIISMHLKQRKLFTYICNFRESHSGDVMLSTDKKVTDFDEDLHEFNDAYELVKKAILHTNDKALIDVVNWNAKVLDYNTQDGKKIRGVTVLKSFKILTEDPSPNTLSACILGWCVEMLQGYFLVADDIMDQSTLRRGKPCWYKMPNVGFIAINDSFLLECNIYKVLETYFKNTNVYHNLVQEFLKVTRNTVYGQALDVLNVPPDMRPRFENFNMEKYKAVVQYKTSHYSFCLPVHLAMHLIGNFSENDFESTKNICLKLGLLFQIQDDYLDIFGDPSITGKVGTDIIDGRCTWFAAYVFENGSESMKKIMIENYGVDKEDSVSKIMKLYNELNLTEKFHECEQALINEISAMIDSLQRKSLQKLFNLLLLKLYKRKK